MQSMGIAALFGAYAMRNCEIDLDATLLRVAPKNFRWPSTA